MRPQRLAGRGLKFPNKYVNLFAGVAHPDPRATAWAPTGLGPGRISRCTTLRSARPSLRLDPHETQRAQRGSLSLRRGSPRAGETRARRGSPSLRGGYPLPPRAAPPHREHPGGGARRGRPSLRRDDPREGAMPAREELGLCPGSRGGGRGGAGSGVAWR